jgi:hypothetical protein
MKKTIFIVCLSSISLVVSGYKDSQSLSVQSEKTFNGYVSNQGSFREIRLVCIQTQRGWQLKKYFMDEPFVRNNGYFGEDFLIPLNPNNKMATNYNMTHYVNTPQGTAYLTIHQ